MSNAIKVTAGPFVAISTKYLGPTDRKGSRVKASASGISVTVSWDHGLNQGDNHAAACKALAEKMNWTGNWYGGGGDGSTMTFVRVEKQI